jgi:hypothetical protein
MGEANLHFILALAIIHDSFVASQLTQRCQAVPGAVPKAPTLPLHMELHIVPLAHGLLFLILPPFHGPANNNGSSRAVP